MKPPRGLSEAEQALWTRVAATVRPLDPRRPLPPVPPAGPMAGTSPTAPVVSKPKGRVPPPRAIAGPTAAPAPAGLDSHWDRRLHSGLVAPDFTLDLHGHSLDGAHRRLDAGLGQAKAMGARLVLVIAGKSRPVEAADRANRRGAIRAKVLDWLAAGPHADAVAAVRPAHRRHGGEGAFYLVLRRPR